MKLLKTQLVKVGDINFPIKITMRSMIEYEALSGGSIASFEGTEKLIQYFYCTAKAGAKGVSSEFNYTYDEFLDLLDVNYLEAITNFSEVITSLMTTDVKKK